MNTRMTLPDTLAAPQPAAALVLQFAHPARGPLVMRDSAQTEPVLKEVRLVPVQAIDFYKVRP
jgi:hypothetical protein